MGKSASTAMRNAAVFSLAGAAILQALRLLLGHGVGRVAPPESEADDACFCTCCTQDGCWPTSVRVSKTDPEGERLLLDLLSRGELEF